MDPFECMQNFTDNMILDAKSKAGFVWKSEKVCTERD